MDSCMLNKNARPNSRLDPPGTPLKSVLVALSILNWNGWRDTIECLKSVLQLDYGNYLIVVVDNGSQDGSADNIKAWAEENLGARHVIADYSRETALTGGFADTEVALDTAPAGARMVIIRSQENLGFTGGNNLSIHYALNRRVPSNCVMLLNNDAKATPDCVARLVAVQLSSGAGIVGAIVMDDSGEKPSVTPFVSPARTLFHTLPFVKLPSPHPIMDDDFIPAPSTHGCAVMISREALQDIYRSRGEYLSSRLYMYRDELDLLFHAEKNGHRAVLATKAFVFHKSGKGPSDENLRVCYYFERNTVIVANEVLPFHLRAIFHTLHIPWSAFMIARHAVRGRGQRARTILRAQLDGYRGVGGKWAHHDRADEAPSNN